MAFIDVSFFSHCIQRNVSFSVFVPIGDKTTSSTFDGKFETLYLLHGLAGDHMDWLRYSKLAFYARGRNIAVVMPAAENKSYIDNPHTLEKFGEFIGKELVDFTRSLFPLSHKREDTAIGGFSMGAYGALRNSLKYNNTFGSAILLSGSLAAEFLSTYKFEDERPNRRRDFIEGVFGDLDAIPSSDADCSALLAKIIKNGGKLPQIYMACGTDDDFLEQNRLYHKIFKENNVPHDYIEDSGGHDWIYWDKHIGKALDWLDSQR